MMSGEGNTWSVAAEDAVDHTRRRYVLSVVKVRIAEHFNLSALNVASLILLEAFTSSNRAVTLYRKLL